MMFDREGLVTGSLQGDGTITPHKVRASGVQTNVIRGFDPGDDLYYLNVQIVESFGPALQALIISVLSSDSSSISADPVTHNSQRIDISQLGAGSCFSVLIPNGEFKRFMGVRYDIFGATPTTGSLIARITSKRVRSIAYPGDFNMQTDHIFKGTYP